MKYLYRCRSTGMGGRTQYYVFRNGEWVAGTNIRSSRSGTHGDSKLEAIGGDLVFHEEVSNSGIHRCLFGIVKNDKIAEFDPKGTPFENMDLPCELPWDEHIW